MKPKEQHPDSVNRDLDDSVNRDLDDEVAAAIEHQYARKLIKPSGKSARTIEQVDKRAAVEAAIDKLGEKPGS